MLTFTYKWLTKHLKFHNDNVLINVDKIIQYINQFGMEIENVKIINPLLVVDIIDVKRQEGVNVSVCQIILPDLLTNLLNYDNNPVQVLCGASNARPGLKTVFAPIGTHLPNVDRDFIIAKRTIKGLDSYGMFCSYKEIGLLNDTDGIIELDQSYKNDLFQFDDIIFNITVPTNRPDLMHVRGIARELSFGKIGQLKELSTKIGSRSMNSKIHSEVPIIFSFCEINNVSVDNEIFELLDRIEQKSSNPLQALNDFILLDIGHPIHIYDKTDCSQLNIRSAKTNELIQTLKNEINCIGKEIIIENQETVLCIGGMIGSQGFRPDTTDILIEAAFFSPENITNNTISKSAKTFYDGIDYEFQLLPYLCYYLNGDISSILITSGLISKNSEFNINFSDYYSLAGTAMSLDNMKILLERYGFSCIIDKIKRDDNINDEFVLKCVAPSWRKDIKYTEDLIAEIIRIQADYSAFNAAIEIPPITHKFTDIYNDIRNFLVVNGFTELYNCPFDTVGDVPIENPMNTKTPFLRNTLMNILLAKAQEQCCNQVNYPVCFFEIGKIYPSEQEKLGVLITNNNLEIVPNQCNSWNQFKQLLVQLSIIANINLQEQHTECDNHFYCKINTPLGFFGHMKYQKQYDKLKDIFYAEFFLQSDKLCSQTLNISNFFDVSVRFSLNVSFTDIQSAINIKAPYILFDVFQSDCQSNDFQSEGFKNYNFHIFTNDQTVITQFQQQMIAINGEIN